MVPLLKGFELEVRARFGYGLLKYKFVFGPFCRILGDTNNKESKNFLRYSYSLCNTNFD